MTSSSSRAVDGGTAQRVTVDAADAEEDRRRAAQDDDMSKKDLVPGA
jgi:hypothetical protein